MAVALLARREEALKEVAQSLRSSLPDAVVGVFPTDTSPESLQKAFSSIEQHKPFDKLKLRVAIYSVKHSSKKPFLDETYDEFTNSIESYVGGAFTFSQESIKRFFADHGDKGLDSGASKKGTLIFTGTLGEKLLAHCKCHSYAEAPLGALRCNAEYAAYGAGRASVRQLAQTLAREMSAKGIHVVHTIANGSIQDENGEDQKSGKKMSAESVGKTYLYLAEQTPDLWTHELDMRPAQEKF